MVTGSRFHFSGWCLMNKWNTNVFSSPNPLNEEDTRMAIVIRPETRDGTVSRFTIFNCPASGRPQAVTSTTYEIRYTIYNTLWKSSLYHLKHLADVLREIGRET